jgi:uncharacterized protein
LQARRRPIRFAGVKTRRRLSLRWRGITLAVAVLVQLPALLTLCHLIDSYTPPIAAAAALTAAYLVGLRTPWDRPPRSRAHLRFGLWPFFSWWSACLVFLVWGPLGWAAARLLSANSDFGLAAAGLVSLAAGARSVWHRPRIVEHDVPIPGLPPAFDGFRVAQLSDVHCGPYASEAHVGRWVGAINRHQVDLVVVTGDLITSGSRYVRAVARALGGLRAREGVYVVMGNHDYFTDGERFIDELERRGLFVLRNRGVTVHRPKGRLFMAGVDDSWTGRADLTQALASRPEGTAVVLLAHDPALFPEAAAQGVALTLSGHTHGGQFAIPGLRQLNLARLLGPYTSGFYRIGQSLLYVNRGSGTSGPPIRLGTRAEAAVLTLRASPAEPADVMEAETAVPGTMPA